MSTDADWLGLGRDAIPPGARFDPITPVAPHGDRHRVASYGHADGQISRIPILTGCSPSPLHRGEPDPDELPRPGVPGFDPLNPSARPRRDPGAPPPGNPFSRNFRPSGGGFGGPSW